MLLRYEGLRSMWLGIIFIGIIAVSQLLLTDPASALEDELYEVNGQIIDAEDHPIVNAKISIRSLSQSVHYGYLETNAMGEFSFQLSAGEYMLREAVTNDPVTRIYGFNRSFTVNGDGVTNLGAYKAAALVQLSGIGMIGDKPAQYPWILVGGLLDGSHSLHQAVGSSDGTGQFTLWVTPGEYDLMIEGTTMNYGRYVDVIVTEAGLTDVIIDMLPYPGILIGRVVNEDGEGLVTRIELSEEGGWWYSNTINTESDGTYILGSETGNVRIWAITPIITNADNSRTGYVQSRLDLNVNEGENTVQDIVVYKGTIFDGMLLQSESPVSFTDYEVYDVSGSQPALVMNDNTWDDGYFELVAPLGDRSNLVMRVKFNGQSWIIPFPEDGTTFGNIDLDNITPEPVVELALDIQLFLGSEDSSFNHLLRSRLNDSAVNSTMEQLTVVLKQGEHDSGTAFTVDDGIWTVQNGALAMLDDYGQLTARLVIPNVPESVTIIEISGGSMKKQVISDIDLTTNTNVPTVVLLPGDIDGDGSITEVDYSSWLALYVKARTGTATVSERIAADMTMDGVVNNLDFSLWLTAYNA